MSGTASSAIHNERVKLRANALDRASTACFAVGVFGPVVAVVGTAASIPPLALVGLAAGFTATGLALHEIAHELLGRLRG